jgi:chromosome segregation ATPase
VKAPTAAEKIAELKRLKATGNAVPINDALPLIKELEKQRDNTFDRLKNAQHDLQQARERSAELEGEIRRLREAIEGFIKGFDGQKPKPRLSIHATAKLVKLRAALAGKD